MKLDRGSRLVIIPKELKEKRTLISSGFDLHKDFLPQTLPKRMNQVQKERAKREFLSRLDNLDDYDNLD